MRALRLAFAFVLLPVATFAACNEQTISDKICELEPGYSPITFLTKNGIYSPPNCSGTSVDYDTYKKPIIDLWKDGDSPLADEICSLQAIFLQPDGVSESWGKYHHPQYNQNGYNQPPQVLADKYSYVFLQKDLFDDKKGFEYILDQRLGSLRGKGGKLLKTLLGPKHAHKAKGAKNKDQLRLALAYILAHEIGHIKYVRDGVKNSNCFKNKIEQISWTPPTSSGDRWRAFGDDDVAKHADLTVKKPKDIETAADLAKIYSSGFATGLAAASSIEDFVEAYSLSVLERVSSDELTITTDDKTDIQVKFRKNAALTEKLACVLDAKAP